MKSHIIQIDKSTWTHDEWLEYRRSGIGGSETGTILTIPDPNDPSRVLSGFNKYESAAQLFFKKIGIIEQQKIEKIEMFMGNYLEDTVADLWSYHDGSLEGMMANYNQGIQVKKCRKINRILKNPNYEWLYANLDRVINIDSNPLQINEEGVLECKTIDKFAAEQWESGVPEYYIFQVQTYLIVADLQYAELAMLKSGRHLEVYPIKRSDILCEQIILQTKEFWDRCLKAFPLVAEMKMERINGRYDRAEAIEREIDDLAPASDSSPAYLEFMKERYRRGDGAERAGSAEEFALALNHAKAQENIKYWEGIELGYKNQLMEAMKYAERLQFEGKQRVDWKMNSAGKRVFRNYVTTKNK